MKLGCNTVIFGSADVETALQHLAWAGYDGAELAAIPNMAQHVPLGHGESQARRAIRERAAAVGLRLLAIEAGGGDAERLEQVCGAAAELGISTVNIGSGGRAGDAASFRETVERLGRMAETAGRHGVVLGVKPHVGAAVYSTETALRLQEGVGSPQLLINFDPSHLYRAHEEVVEAARRLAPVMCVSHVRDCASREQKVGPPETQVPGRGSIDIPAVLRALREGGFDGNLDLEIIGAHGYPVSRAMGLAAEARGYLHRCLQELEG